MSQLNPSEISSVLKEKIAGLDLSAERKNEGIIVHFDGENGRPILTR